MSTHGSPAADTAPWLPPLALIVREISSVSATFILSFSISDQNRDTVSLHTLDDDNDLDTNNTTDAGNKISRKRSSFISEILAKGLFSVNVNGALWQRIFIRVADSGDEAIIIIYGLFPGRQYDIDLGLVQDGQSSTIRSHFTTENRDNQEALDAHVESGELTALDSTPTSPTSDHFPHDSSHASSASTSSSSSFTTDFGSSHTSHNGSSRSASPSASSDTPSANVAPESTEEHVNQLEQTLTVLKAEEEALTTSLKSARRESQKADAALRAEIEVLKRASEKHAAAEQRAKQKILALQETHKRAVAAAQESEKELAEVEASLPDLMKEKEEKEKECEKLEAEAGKVRKERERIEEAEKKQIESMNAELSALNHKLEKLGGKRDKLETSTIPDQEGQLEEMIEEIKKIEAEEQELERIFITMQNGFTHPLKTTVDEMGVLQPPTRGTTVPIAQQSPQQQRSRHNSLHTGAPPGLTGGQSIPPGQRSTNVPHPHLQQTWNGSSPRQAQPQRQQHSPRTYSYPQCNSLPNVRPQLQQPPIILSNPNRKPTILKPTSSTFHSPSSSSHGSLTKSSPSNSASPPTSPLAAPELAHVSAIASSSTLSSRAPAFEPSLGLGILSKGTPFHQRSGHTPSLSMGTSNAPVQGALRTPVTPLSGRSLWSPAQEQETGSR